MRDGSCGVIEKLSGASEGGVAPESNAVESGTLTRQEKATQIKDALAANYHCDLSAWANPHCKACGGSGRITHFVGSGTEIKTRMCNCIQAIIRTYPAKSVRI